MFYNVAFLGNSRRFFQNKMYTFANFRQIRQSLFRINLFLSRAFDRWCSRADDSDQQISLLSTFHETSTQIIRIKKKNIKKAYTSSLLSSHTPTCDHSKIIVVTSIYVLFFCKELLQRQSNKPRCTLVYSLFENFTKNNGFSNHVQYECVQLFWAQENK